MSAVLNVEKIFSEDKNINEAIFSINKDSLIFEEHFPGLPVLPGAITISSVISVNNLFFKMKLLNFVLKEIVKFAFIKRIDPSQKIHMKCTYHVKSSECIVSVVVADNSSKTCAKGYLLYAKDDLS